MLQLLPLWRFDRTWHLPVAKSGFVIEQVMCDWVYKLLLSLHLHLQLHIWSPVLSGACELSLISPWPATCEPQSSLPAKSACSCQSMHAGWEYQYRASTWHFPPGYDATLVVLICLTRVTRLPHFLAIETLACPSFPSCIHTHDAPMDSIIVYVTTATTLSFSSTWLTWLLYFGCGNLSLAC